MSAHFTHLHLHTEYSLLDGAIGLDSLIDFSKRNEFKAIAITDHGNIFGAVKFFQKCKKAGIKPILGMEAYTTQTARIKSNDNRYHHLVLLVQNMVGYRNLCKLISFSYQEGFYFKPRIDYEILQKHSEGLIALSGCLGGHIPQLLMNNEQEKAEQQLDWFLSVFNDDRFFLEVQPPDLKEQAVLNEKIFELSARRTINIVATADCHYVNADDRYAHEVMLAIQTQDKMSNDKRYTFGDCRVHLRTTNQMLEIFSQHPEVVWQTGAIADRCEFDFETGKLFFPHFEIPADYTSESYFKKLCHEGFERLIQDQFIPVDLQKIYTDRLQQEIDLIVSMGFVGYFLVVSDFIQWAHRSNIPVGPGRGSGAGSLVAWTLQITNIDPIKYNLLFERFLNPERISMPDFDIDFCIEGRDRIIEYIKQKYGHDKVCHIITFGTMLAKGVIKDVARVLGFSFEDSNAITSLIPDQLKITLQEAIEQEPRLRELITKNVQTKQLFDIAFKLEGLTRHASKHAAGIVISPEPVDEVLPLYVPPKTNELVSQYGMTELESIGFLKIDLLGLKNLTLIKRVIDMVQMNHGVSINGDKIPLDDEKTFALIGAGMTSGVFQLESDGLKDVLIKLLPDKFEDIIAVNALYRPGPLGSGMVDDFIERRHGRQKITYIFPELEPILQETYGVIVYQEQVMKVASVIGGYTLGQADILRKAMGKKKADVMVEQRAIFLQKATARGFDEKKSGELFDLMEYFAGYGFNKAHSTAYAFIAYQTAYLKAHYPAEFMACLISLEATHPEKMVFYIQEARQMGLVIMPPDINQSAMNFSVVNGTILFGLHGIKNVGCTALENIISVRSAQGAFVDILDFCKRIDLRVVNKRVIESLISAGAGDSLPGTRAQKYNDLALIMDRAAEIKKDMQTGQMGLFNGAMRSVITEPDASYTFTTMIEWNNQETLSREKEVLGFYLSSHPLMLYGSIMKWFGVQSFEKAQQNALVLTEHTGTVPKVLCAALLKSCKQIMTKKGDRMAFLSCEDMGGNAEIILFPKTFAKVAPWLDSYHCFLIKGTVDPTSTKQCKIKADEFIPFECLWHDEDGVKKITLSLPHEINDQLLQNVRSLLSDGSVPLTLLVYEHEKVIHLAVQKSVNFDVQIGQQLERLGLQITAVLE